MNTTNTMTLARLNTRTLELIRARPAAAAVGALAIGYVIGRLVMR